MDTLLPTLISWLQIYGYPALALCVLIASIGAPLPISLLLLALGAFSALGDFNLILLSLIAVSASVAGDNIGYLIGKKIGPKLLSWLKKPRRRQLISPQILARSEAYFHSKGSWAIFLSRCLIPALGGCINLLAGIEEYPYRRFLAYDISGEAIGNLLPLLLGYIFGASWEAVGDLMDTASLLIVAFLLAIYLTVLLLRTVKKMRAVKASKRISEASTLYKEENASGKLTFLTQNGSQD